ncbi:MAG: hypothetical protein JWS11_2926 [Cypionkella sp.]|nr:hypothetical protein [Cypionkella sp.]
MAGFRFADSTLKSKKGGKLALQRQDPHRIFPCIQEFRVCFEF